MAIKTSMSAPPRLWKLQRKKHGDDGDDSRYRPGMFEKFLQNKTPPFGITILVPAT
jgi:hypothetical protein